MPQPETHNSFVFERSTRIETLNIELQEFRHTATGAVHIHIQADDQQNAFLVAFRTVPEDSTGVAHVLEHTALCGSRRYPVRDPFFYDDAPLVEYVYECLYLQRLDGLPLCQL